MIRLRVAPGQLVVGPLSLSGDEARYLAQVRRAKVGDEVALFDGGGRIGRAHVDRLASSGAALTVLEVSEEPPSRPTIAAMIPWIKGERMDWCVEKLVELGVDEVCVYGAEHAVVRLDGARLAQRVDRLQRAAVAAARQAGRGVVPAVRAVADVPTVIALSAAAGAAGWWCHPAGDAPARWEHPPARLSIVTGPEGGLSHAEEDALANAAFSMIQLSPHVLRAETAPAVAVALARYVATGPSRAV